MRNLNVGAAEVGVLARMLRGIEFFAPLTMAQIEKVLPYILLQAYEPGEVVFKQGQVGDAFYIVYSGRVEIKVRKGLLSFGKAVAQLGPGQFFGEMALLSAEPRSATVSCLEPTQVFVLVASDFQFTLRSNPGMAAEMQRIAARRKFDSSQKSR